MTNSKIIHYISQAKFLPFLLQSGCYTVLHWHSNRFFCQLVYGILNTSWYFACRCIYNHMCFTVPECTTNCVLCFYYLHIFTLFSTTNFSSTSLFDNLLYTLSSIFFRPYISLSTLLLKHTVCIVYITTDLITVLYTFILFVLVILLLSFLLLSYMLHPVWILYISGLQFIRTWGPQLNSYQWIAS